VREEGDAVAKRTSALAVGMAVVAAVMAGPIHATQGQALADVDPPVASAAPRVRTEDAGLSRLIQQATSQSPTFRQLVETVQATDGIVYVMRGRCGHYVQACLKLWMAVAGPNRILHVVVDERKPDVEAMASIAHELQHALEVLAEPSVRTGAGMLALYKRNGAVRSETFETKAAIDTGDAVYKELTRAARLLK
jgi:hypothetical protein